MLQPILRNIWLWLPGSLQDLSSESRLVSEELISLALLDPVSTYAHISEVVITDAPLPRVLGPVNVPDRADFDRIFVDVEHRRTYDRILCDRCARYSGIRCDRKQVPTSLGTFA